jgi:catechol 2,3-dioxygenase-like lactoylglutathione lyase family enzyme
MAARAPAADAFFFGTHISSLLEEEGETTMQVLKPHVSLNISNIDASVAFYEKVFGVTASKRRPGYAKFDLQEPSLNLTMQEASRSGVNASHFGVQVASTEDVASAWSRFKAAGLKTLTEENTTCCYAMQDKVWVEDPDGNMWEVFVVKADAATMHDDPAKAAAVACCAPSALPAQDKPVQLGKKSGCC